MTGIQALMGGFGNFFSIWQVCILQISPFFMFFIVGLYLVGYRGQGAPCLQARVLLPSLSYLIGFSILFAPLNARGWSIGREIAYNLSVLGLASGWFLLVVSLYFLLSGRVDWPEGFRGKWVGTGMAFLIGCAFSFVYSPCITPELSIILGIGSRPETALEGAFYAFFYGSGMSFAMGLVAYALIFALKDWLIRRQRLVLDVCGGVLVVLAGLNVSGVMVYYKAFILGFLVP
ncbi:MAG: hypothetical protein HQL52_11760 [Magnetococcales bacterium]|nr:hypothetical protein [Magnetococcales bacterium]